MKNVEKDDLWVLLLSTIRYSFGRRTYMTSFSCELVLRYHEALSDAQLKQISREVFEELKLHRRLGRRLPDEKIWLQGAVRIRRLARKRSLRLAYVAGPFRTKNAWEEVDKD